MEREEAISERAASARNPPVKVAVLDEDPVIDGARKEDAAFKNKL